MGNAIVAVIGQLGYAAGLGKKSTSTDITMYDVKKGEETVTFVEPTRYPERLAPLFFATSMAQKAIVVVDELNAAFGECAVILQCSGMNKGYFVLRNYMTREKIAPLIKGTNLENFEFIEDNPTLLREKLLAEAAQEKPAEASARTEGTVLIDHSFNVKGVGVVILGVVTNGTVMKHDQMRVLPGAKIAQVRSIQKHDDEFDVASEGDRVGLALKNVDIQDLERGTTLTTDPTIKTTKSLETTVDLVRYWATPIKSGMGLHIGHGMQFAPCKADSVTDEGDWRKPTVTLKMEKEFVYRPGDRAVVTYLEGGKLRVAGTLSLP